MRTGGQWACAEAHCQPHRPVAFPGHVCQRIQLCLSSQRRKNRRPKDLVTVSSGTTGVCLFRSQNQRVLGFWMWWSQQELVTTRAKLVFAAWSWKGSIVSAEQRRALSLNLTDRRSWKCGTRGPDPVGTNHLLVVCGLDAVGLLQRGRLSSMMPGPTMSNNGFVACRTTHSACFKQVTFK